MLLGATRTVSPAPVPQEGQAVQGSSLSHPHPVPAAHQGALPRSKLSHVFLEQLGRSQRVKCCCQQPLAVGMDLSPSCHSHLLSLELQAGSVGPQHPWHRAPAGFAAEPGFAGQLGFAVLPAPCKARIFSLLLGVPHPCLWTGGGGSPGTVVGTVTVWELGGDSAWPLWDTMEIWDVITEDQGKCCD